jgi:hypothetical protein
MADALAKGSRVERHGMGNFFLKEYKGCTGWNPKPGKPVTIKAKRLSFFKAGKELKERVKRRDSNPKIGSQKNPFRLPKYIPIFLIILKC